MVDSGHLLPYLLPHLLHKRWHMLYMSSIVMAHPWRLCSMGCATECSSRRTSVRYHCSGCGCSHAAMPCSTVRMRCSLVMGVVKTGVAARRCLVHTCLVHTSLVHTCLVHTSLLLLCACIVHVCCMYAASVMGRQDRRDDSWNCVVCASS